MQSRETVERFTQHLLREIGTNQEILGHISQLMFCAFWCASLINDKYCVVGSVVGVGLRSPLMCSTQSFPPFLLSPSPTSRIPQLHERKLLQMVNEGLWL